VHPEWTLLEGQFGWLLLIIFTSLLIAGPGRLVVGQRFS
jgi:putative oxidoreductase